MSNLTRTVRSTLTETSGKRASRRSRPSILTACCSELKPTCRSFPPGRRTSVTRSFPGADIVALILSCLSQCAFFGVALTFVFCLFLFQLRMFAMPNALLPGNLHARIIPFHIADQSFAASCPLCWAPISVIPGALEPRISSSLICSASGNEG